MDEGQRDEGLDMFEPANAVAVRRRPGWARAASLFALGLLLLLFAAIAVVWMERRPIAVHYLEGEFERRGVTASYHLVRVGLHTQEVTGLVIGDPRRPDLVARYAHIETRLQWNGNFQVFRIVARGVRLRGRLINGRISWGEIDKLLPSPTNKPFALPDFVVDIADSSISLATPFGPLGLAVEGNGKLSGGFLGHTAIVSPELVSGRCAATNLRANLAIAVVGRRPQVDGPVALDRFSCPNSRFSVAFPRFGSKANFNEALTNVDGSGKLGIAALVAGTNGLANLAGEISYKGSLAKVDGRFSLLAQKSRLATLYADRTELGGTYRLTISDGTFRMVGNYAAGKAMLDPRMVAGIAGPLRAASKTPIGPVAASLGAAISNTARSFNSAGELRLVNFPGWGAVRITAADVLGQNGARAHLSGASGLTYYWPSNGLRIDTNIRAEGGGLPQGILSLRQSSAQAPMSGLAEFVPYSAGRQHLAFSPIHFGPGPNGSTTIDTIAELDGPFADGRVEALRLPIKGEIGKAGSFAFGTSCIVLSFKSLSLRTVTLGAARLPVCPIGSSIVSKRSGGDVLATARFNRPLLSGSIGSSPFRVEAASGEFFGQRVSFDNLSLALGREASPILLDAARLTANIARNLSGNFTGATGTIGNVPLKLGDASGNWRLNGRDLSIEGALTVSDRNADPRFTPLRGSNVHFSLAGDYVRATGALNHPATGTLVGNIDIEHRLSTGTGHALLDVPGLAFSPKLQPEEITNLTEGVIALVKGTLIGKGRIDWEADGKVSSTGDFSTAPMDLAAPFGTVTGLSGAVHFDDLLGLATPPGQIVSAKLINTGILVENGVISYQLLPDHLVRIERGEWPFMGGRLILETTVLNFARPTAKRLTFHVVGLDGHTFVSSLGFKELDATGTFDGVLPMIFDEEGGRIIGGRLDSRVSGGELAYNGVVNKAELGTMGDIAFNALRDLRFHSMIIRLDGDLAGEFTTRLNIEGVGLGQSTKTQRIIRGLLRKIPLKLNVTISGPFRALIATAKAVSDPRTQIGDVLPRPLEDVSGIATEVRSVEENEQQTQTPVTQKVNVALPPKK